MPEFWILVGSAAFGFTVAPSFHPRLQIFCLIVAVLYEFNLRLSESAAEAPVYAAFVRGFAIGVAVWSLIGFGSKGLKR